MSPGVRDLSALTPYVFFFPRLIPKSTWLLVLIYPLLKPLLPLLIPSEPKGDCLPKASTGLCIIPLIKCKGEMVWWSTISSFPLLLHAVDFNEDLKHHLDLALVSGQMSFAC